MKYLDYIFYRICVLSKNNIEDLDYALNGFIAISFFECLNWATIGIIIDTIFKRNFFDSPISIIIPIIIINVINFNRYDKIVTFEVLEERWKNESIKVRYVRGIMVLTYMILTIVALVIAGYILFSQPWRKLSSNQ